MEKLKNDDIENIKFINEQLNTNYRYENFDLSKGQDLLQALNMVTAEYIDMLNYKIIISLIDENFDSTLERVKTHLWAKLSRYNSTGNQLIDDTINHLNKLSNNLFQLMEESKNNCRELWEMLLFDNKFWAYKNNLILGINYYEEEEIKIALQFVFDDISLAYIDNIENATREFSNKLLLYLKRNRKAKIHS